MSSTSRTDRNRGKKDFRRQLVPLRERWPLAFPNHEPDVRPLVVKASREIAAGMGWSVPYALGVLDRWKMTPAYGEAIVRCDKRINLDGTLAEPVYLPARNTEAFAGPGNKSGRCSGRKAAGAHFANQQRGDAYAPLGSIGDIK